MMKKLYPRTCIPHETRAHFRRLRRTATNLIHFKWTLDVDSLLNVAPSLVFVQGDSTIVNAFFERFDIFLGHGAFFKCNLDI